MQKVFAGSAELGRCIWIAQRRDWMEVEEVKEKVKVEMVVGRLIEM